jgi:transposase
MAELKWFVGVDWGASKHQVTMLDGTGRVVFAKLVEHDGEELAKVASALVDAAGGDAASIAVAIETPHGAVVSTMLERGMAVYSINPKQLDRFRDRHTVAGAKDDRRDAFVLGDSLRTDMPLFRAIRPPSARLVELRELVAMHEELRTEHNQLANRLYEQLLRFYPQALALGSVHSDRWLLALIERAPTPGAGARLSLAKVGSILKSYSIRRVTPERVREVLTRPALVVAPGVENACVRHIQLLMPKLRANHDERKAVDRAMEELLDELSADQGSADDEQKPEHRDAQILRSLPGVGTIVGATMLAEAWRPLAERDYSTLRAYTGVAPVTKQSGKSLRVQRRYQFNERLGVAIFFWARTAVCHDPRAQAQYRRLRKAGHSPGRALRGVADRLLAMLTAMLRSNTTYDPQRRLARQCAA